MSTLTIKKTEPKLIKSSSKLATSISNWRKQKTKALENALKNAKKSMHKTIIEMISFNDDGDCIVFKTIGEKDTPSKPNDKILVQRTGKRTIGNEEYTVTLPVNIEVERCSSSEIESWLRKQAKDLNCLVSLEILQILEDKVHLMKADASDMSAILTGNGIKEVKFFQRNGILNIAGRKAEKKALKA